MGNTFYFAWEVALMEWLQNTLNGGFFVTLGSFITNFGEDIVLVAITGFLYWCYDKDFGKYVGTNVIMAVVWNPMIKNVFLRRRPYFDNPSIQCLKPVEADADIYDIAAQGYSFPSGHSMNSATVYGSTAYYGKKKWLWIVSVILPILVGVSRFYLGVHYPTDVLVGWLCGVLTIVICTALQKKIKNEAVLYGILILTGIPGLFYCTSDDYFSAFGMMIGAFAGFLFEKKYVNFTTTKKPVRMILRVVGGGACYFALNTLLKLPFSHDFLYGGTTAAHWVRIGRYVIVLFFLIGIYPMIFKLGDKIFHKEAEK